MCCSVCQVTSGVAANTSALYAEGHQFKLLKNQGDLKTSALFWSDHKYIHIFLF